MRTRRPACTALNFSSHRAVKPVYRTVAERFAPRPAFLRTLLIGVVPAAGGVPGLHEVADREVARRDYGAREWCHQSHPPAVAIVAGEQKCTTRCASLSHESAHDPSCV